MLTHYEFKELSLSGVFKITPFQSSDDRGMLIKDYVQEVFEENGIKFEPVENLCIYSKRNVLRGLHFQRMEEQDKLIRCISGLIWAVVVDLRYGSPTFGSWIGEELAHEKELYIPRGFALGTYALQDSILECKCGEKFCPEYDDGICWNDEDLNICWPIEADSGVPIVSAKDKNLQKFKDYAKTLTLI